MVISSEFLISRSYSFGTSIWKNSLTGSTPNLLHSEDIVQHFIKITSIIPLVDSHSKIFNKISIVV